MSDKEVVYAVGFGLVAGVFVGYCVRAMLLYMGSV